MGRREEPAWAKGTVGLMAAREQGYVDRQFQNRLTVTRSMIDRLGLETELNGHMGCVNCLEWNHDGSVLASASDDLHVILWDPYRYKQLHNIATGHTGNIFSVKFLSPELVATCAADGTVRARSVCGGAPLLECSCHCGRVKRLAVAPHNPHLIWSAGEDGLILQHDLRTAHRCSSANVLVNLLNHLGRYAEAKCVAVNPRRPYQLAVGANDLYVRLYDTRMIKLSKLQVVVPGSRVSWERQTVRCARAGAGDPDHNIPRAARRPPTGPGSRVSWERQTVRCARAGAGDPDHNIPRAAVTYFAPGNAQAPPPTGPGSRVSWERQTVRCARAGAGDPDHNIPRAAVTYFAPGNAPAPPPTGPGSRVSWSGRRCAARAPAPATPTTTSRAPPPAPYWAGSRVSWERQTVRCARAGAGDPDHNIPRAAVTYFAPGNAPSPAPLLGRGRACRGSGRRCAARAPAPATPTTTSRAPPSPTSRQVTPQAPPPYWAGVARVVGAADGHLSIEPNEHNFPKKATTYVAFSHDGTELLVNLGSEQIYLFDVNSGRRPVLVESFIIQHNHAHRTAAPPPAAPPPPAQPPLPPHVKILKDRANEQVNKANYAAAVELYNAALGESPHTAILYSNRAAALMRRGWSGDTYAAIKDCYRAIKLDPTHVKSHFRLAKGLMDLKRAREAHECLLYFKDKFPRHNASHAVFLLQKDINVALDTVDTQPDEAPGEAEENQPTSVLERQLRAAAVDYSQRFLGHCNTTTDIKEASFLGPDANFIAAGGSWDTATPPPTSRRPASWGPTPTSLLLAVPGTLQHHHRHQGGQLPGARRQLHCCWVRRYLYYSQRFLGHCNTTTDIKEASFLGPDANFIAAGGSWDTATPPPTSRRPASWARRQLHCCWVRRYLYYSQRFLGHCNTTTDIKEASFLGPDANFIAAAVPGTLQHHHRHQGGQLPGARRQLHCCWVRRYLYYSQRFLGHCNTTTDIKEASFLGPDANFIAAGGSWDTATPPPTSRRPASWGPTPTSLLLAVPGTLQHHHRHQGGQLPGARRQLHCCWVRRYLYYSQRFLGHCNTTTDIKEASFLGPDANFIAAGGSWDTATPPPTSRRPASWGPTPTSLLLDFNRAESRLSQLCTIKVCTHYTVNVIGTSDDGSMFIWCRRTGNIVRCLRGDESIVNCVQLHPAACLLATSGIEPCVRLWSPRPEDGVEEPRVVLDAGSAAHENQRRMRSDPFEAMLLNISFAGADRDLHSPACRAS
ncbi:hypothetical protein MSG28_009489 [Choristoneura fumiferana]|uniref:Uncharacterized protein n=1 Tax=Choristoneura fumiferana TaxID=7141 RepID=A0ACC0JBF0_CHOFU|nr:hypothetical protein MSG28_009489 [Choristoneura fumiferana]